jgi:hypothetical protein
MKLQDKLKQIQEQEAKNFKYLIRELFNTECMKVKNDHLKTHVLKLAFRSAIFEIYKEEL